MATIQWWAVWTSSENTSCSYNSSCVHQKYRLAQLRPIFLHPDSFFWHLAQDSDVMSVLQLAKLPMWKCRKYWPCHSKFMCPLVSHFLRRCGNQELEDERLSPPVYLRREYIIWAFRRQGAFRIYDLPVMPRQPIRNIRTVQLQHNMTDAEAKEDLPYFYRTAAPMHASIPVMSRD